LEVLHHNIRFVCDYISVVKAKPIDTKADDYATTLEVLEVDNSGQ